MRWRGTSQKWMSLLFGLIAACGPQGSPAPAEGDAASRPVMPSTLPVAMASYDETLQVPMCSECASGCDSGELFDGRGPLGPEPHAPNTLGGTCLDGSAGTYHKDESIDRIRLYTADGSELAPGKEVTIEVTLWAYSPGNRVDLYSAADANHPEWTFIKVLTPPGPGASTLTTTFTLPSDGSGVQAVRAELRYTGASTSCDGDGYNDRDDLAFKVSTGTGCSGMTPP